MSNIAQQRRGEAFTLIELLVVVAIIALLASILVPTLNRARELTKRTVCSTNLNGIGQGIKLYTLSNGNRFPTVPLTGGASWGSKIGDNWNSNPFVNTGNDRCNSTNMFLLIRGNYASGKLFICPSTSDTEEPDFGNTGRWDFTGSTHISFGMQNPYGFDNPLSISSPSSAAWFADGSPYVFEDGNVNAGQVNTGSSVVNWAGGNEDDNKRNGNSPNHNREGQNVCYGDGHVKWQENANCGTEHDNIYAGTGTDDEVSQGGSLGNLHDPWNNRKDSYILP